MVHKIQSSEYLKRYDNMSADERSAYEKRVGDWLSSEGCQLAVLVESFDARLQNVATMSTSWNDDECAAFEEGAKLLSALTGIIETPLPDLLYSIAVRRSFKKMRSALSAVLDTRNSYSDSAHANLEGGVGVATETPLTPDNAHFLEPALKQGQGGVTPQKTATKSPKNTPSGEGVTIPVRPKHIDQYVHLLPAKTQERASQVKDLLRELDIARENARLLMDSGEHGDKISAWARKATQLDNNVHSIYRELDNEWEKLVKNGRVTVDDFGNAHIVDEGSGTPAKQELTSEQKIRRRDLRKWLIDTRRGSEGKARERRITQWKENWEEYLTLEPLQEALRDKKIVDAAKHFGIDINPSK